LEKDAFLLQKIEELGNKLVPISEMLNRINQNEKIEQKIAEITQKMHEII
jgi:hypothetical protein